MRLAQGGYRVLVSQATDVPLETGTHPNIESRSGPFEEHGLAELVEHRNICAMVDATHPYAAAIHATAIRVAEMKGIPCFRFVRPAAIDATTPGVEFTPNHSVAAVAAFRRGQPVLLTIGTRNLAPYAEQSRHTGLPLIVRVLDHPHSLETCHRAGISPEHILAGRGPFSVQDNRRHIRDFSIGVLVTKDSGEAGGTVEKIQAARAEGCDIIVVTRPDVENKAVFINVDSLIEALVHACVRNDS
jgi:precorrin-6A/cobalt-precorrin-6A reductase